MNALLSNNFCFVHFLHSINFLTFFQANTPHLTKASLSDHILTVKVIPVNLPALQDQPFFGFISFEFRQIDFETVLDFLVGFLRDGRIASIVFFFSSLWVVGRRMTIVLLRVSSRYNSSIAVDAHLSD